MIIYGWKAAHLRSTQSKTAVCPSCKTQGSTVISVFSRHVHIFWIPLFPYGKTGTSQCQHCQHTMKVKQMPEEIKREYKNLKMDVKPHIWQFSGLVLISFLIAWGIYSSKENDKKNLEYIGAPKVGDIYEYKTESGYYSSLKVVNVSTDSIRVVPNEYEIEKKTGIYRIDKPENYGEFSYGLSKQELIEMFTSEEIYEVNR